MQPKCSVADGARHDRLVLPGAAAGLDLGATEVTESTKPTDLGDARSCRTSPYKYESSYLPAVPALQRGVSTRPREPGLRVEDWTWEARRVRSSLG